MPILFSLVARGTTVLAKYASCAGNFMEVVEQVLAKISPENAKLSYIHGSYLFHYVTESRVIYICVTDDALIYYMRLLCESVMFSSKQYYKVLVFWDFERSKAFAFLSEIKRRFQNQYGDRARTALPYAMNSEFSKVLAAQMRHESSDCYDPDKITQVEEQVDELKGIMVKNIDQLANRGERLELLVDKTEDLNTHKSQTRILNSEIGSLITYLTIQNHFISSVTFKKSSRNLARSMWWKNVKLTIIIVVVAIIVVYIIVSIACGGMDWGKCVHH